jgi:peptide/nickel transport system permease protein
MTQSASTATMAAVSKKPPRRRLRQFLSAWDTRLCLVIAAGLLVLLLMPTSVWPETRTLTDLRRRYEAPRLFGNDTLAWLGTDALGRDVLVRILSSTRLTLTIAGLATLISTVFGVAAGLAAGYFRGAIDSILSRFIDIFLAFPTLLLVLALIAAVGQSSWAVIGVLALSGWAGYARVIRGATLQLSSREFVEAARCIGASDSSILIRHLLPNIVTPIAVLSTLNIASFILTESAISYLGLGPAPPEITWGGLIGDGRQGIYDAWWVALFPGMAIVVTVLTLGFLGDAIRDAFDPQARR